MNLEIFSIIHLNLCQPHRTISFVYPTRQKLHFHALKRIFRRYPSPILYMYVYIIQNIISNTSTSHFLGHFPCIWRTPFSDSEQESIQWMVYTTLFVVAFFSFSKAFHHQQYHFLFTLGKTKEEKKRKNHSRELTSISIFPPFSPFPFKSVSFVIPYLCRFFSIIYLMERFFLIHIQFLCTHHSDSHVNKRRNDKKNTLTSSILLSSPFLTLCDD